MSAFRYAGYALIIGALAHIVGHVLGPDAIAFMGAPPDVVQGAADGTAYYYAMIVGIIGLLSGLAWLAIKRNSARWARIILWVFAVIFTLRGLVVVFFFLPLIRGTLGPDPAKFWFHFSASLFVLSIGLALFRGLWKSRLAKRPTS